MKVEYINPFITSTISTFRTMLGCRLARKEPFVKGVVRPEHEVSGVIGLSGKAKGTVVLSLSREAALQATAAMLGEHPPEINADVADAVGELTNIIAGASKAQLEHLKLNVSLPTVISGRWHTIEFPREVTPICIPFGSPWGSIAVEVGLLEQPVPAAGGSAEA